MSFIFLEKFWMLWLLHVGVEDTLLRISFVMWCLLMDTPTSLPHPVSLALTQTMLRTDKHIGTCLELFLEEINFWTNIHQLHSSQLVSWSTKMDHSTIIFVLVSMVSILSDQKEILWSKLEARTVGLQIGCARSLTGLMILRAACQTARALNLAKKTTVTGSIWTPLSHSWWRFVQLSYKESERLLQVVTSMTRLQTTNLMFLFLQLELKTQLTLKE